MTDRVPPGRLLAGCFALRASTLVALPVLLGPSPGPVLIVTVVVFGLLDVATVPPVIAECRRISGDDGPVAFGWVNTAHQVGAGAMALFGTAARDVAGSYTPAFVVGAVLCVAAALVLSLRGRDEHRGGRRS